jgi:hypothetical protein
LDSIALARGENFSAMVGIEDYGIQAAQNVREAIVMSG